MRCNRVSKCEVRTSELRALNLLCSKGFGSATLSRLMWRFRKAHTNFLPGTPFFNGSFFRLSVAIIPKNTEKDSARLHLASVVPWLENRISIFTVKSSSSSIRERGPFRFFTSEDVFARFTFLCEVDFAKWTHARGLRYGSRQGESVLLQYKINLWTRQLRDVERAQQNINWVFFAVEEVYKMSK